MEQSRHRHRHLACTGRRLKTSARRNICGSVSTSAGCTAACNLGRFVFHISCLGSVHFRLVASTASTVSTISCYSYRDIVLAPAVPSFQASNQIQQICGMRVTTVITVTTSNAHRLQPCLWRGWARARFTCSEQHGTAGTADGTADGALALVASIVTMLQDAHNMHTICHSIATALPQHCHSIATALPQPAMAFHLRLSMAMATPCYAGLRFHRLLHLHCPSKHRPAKESSILLDVKLRNLLWVSVVSVACILAWYDKLNSELAFCRAFVFSSAQRPKSSQLCAFGSQSRTTVEASVKTSQSQAASSAARWCSCVQVWTLEALPVTSCHFMCMLIMLLLFAASPVLGASASAAAGSFALIPKAVLLEWT